MLTQRAIDKLRDGLRSDQALAHLANFTNGELNRLSELVKSGAGDRARRPENEINARKA